MEEAFGEHFTAVVEENSLDDIYRKCKEVIAEQSGTIIWIPQKESL